VTAVDEVAGTTVAFDNGEVHTYNLASQRKLRPMLDDAHQLTSETLFRLVDTDSSGSLDLKECAPPPPPQPHCATRPARRSCRPSDRAAPSAPAGSLTSTG
jgi:hypothetical protein